MPENRRTQIEYSEMPENRRTQIEYNGVKVYTRGVERSMIREVHDSTKIPRARGGSFKDGFFYKESSYGDNRQFAFSYQGLLFCVDFLLSMPQQMSDQMGFYIEPKYLEPTKSKVISDFNTIKKEFIEIRRLAKEGRHQEDFVWSQDPFSRDLVRRIRVYDRSAFPTDRWPYHSELDGRIFYALKRAEQGTRDVPYWAIDKKVSEAVRLADCIPLEKRDSVQAPTLEMATRAAIKIYETFTREPMLIDQLLKKN